MHHTKLPFHFQLTHPWYISIIILFMYGKQNKKIELKRQKRKRIGKHHHQN